MSSVRKMVNIITLLGCLGFVFLGLCLYFIKGVPLQPVLLLGVLFFGTGAVVMVISLTSEHEKWSINEKKLSKKKAVAMGICSIIFSFCAFWLAVFSNINIFLRLFLFIGFISIGQWGLVLLVRQFRHRRDD